jgi:hypothetical protein
MVATTGFLERGACPQMNIPLKTQSFEFKQAFTGKVPLITIGRRTRH